MTLTLFQYAAGPTTSFPGPSLCWAHSFGTSNPARHYVRVAKKLWVCGYHPSGRSNVRHSAQHYAINQLINAKYQSVGNRNKTPILNDI